MVLSEVWGPLPPKSTPRPPYPAKGKINMAFPQHSTQNIIVTASYPDVSLSLAVLRIIIIKIWMYYIRSSTFRSTRKIFFTYGIQYRFKAQFLNSIYLIGKISKLSLCTKLKTDAAFPPYILNLTTFQISACYCFNQRFQLGCTRYKSPVQVTPPSHVLQARQCSCRRIIIWPISGV